MMKSKILFLTIFCVVAICRAQQFELIKEIKYNPNLSGIDPIDNYEINNGMVLAYDASITGGLQRAHNAVFIDDKGTYVHIYSQNESAPYTVFSKTAYRTIGDVNDNKLVLYDPHANEIILQIRELTTGNVVENLRPDFSAIKRYETLKEKRLGAYCYDCPFTFKDWKHSYKASAIFKNHLVLTITSKAGKAYYENPAIIDFSQPEKLIIVNPTLPPSETEREKAGDLGAWGYGGSTEDYHFYFRGYWQKGKGKNPEIGTNEVARITNSGKVESLFTIDMTMPDITLKKYISINRLTNNKVDYKIDDCLYLFAYGEDKNGKDVFIVKKISFEGKVIWQQHYPFKSNMRGIVMEPVRNYDQTFALQQYNTARFILDESTGEIKSTIDLSASKPDLYPTLDRIVKDDVRNFAKQDKNILSTYLIKQFDNYYLIVFKCQNNKLALYNYKP